MRLRVAWVVADDSASNRRVAAHLISVVEPLGTLVIRGLDHRDHAVTTGSNRDKLDQRATQGLDELYQRDHPSLDELDDRQANAVISRPRNCLCDT